MADLVKFFVGNQENLDDLQKIKGQLVIALDTSNPASPKGTLYYDYDATQRIKLQDEIAKKAIGDETGLNIRNNYLTSIQGSRNKDSYTITAKSGSGVTKNTVNIPINLVGSSATSSKIFLLGATTQSNDGNNSYTNNNFYIESNVLNGTFKGNLTGNATSATKATNDGTGANINTTYVKSVTGASGTGYTITVTKGSGSTSSFTIPLATTGGLGLVSIGTQSFAGAKTFTSTVTVNGDVYIGNNGKGYYLKDKKSRNYAGLNDNGSNFWIGSSGSSGGSHYGGTYLSTGFDDNDEGNDTFIVSIPHIDASGTYSHTGYYGLHSGNWKSYISDWRSLSWTNGTTAGPVPVFTDRVGGGKTNGAAIPIATSAVSGVVSTGTQTFAGDKTFTGTVILSKTNDANISLNNNPALIVGGTASSAHLELDANEILSKPGETGYEILNLNTEGGRVQIGANQTDDSTELNVYGIIRGRDIRPLATNTYSLGSNERIWKYVYANRLIGCADEAKTIIDTYPLDTSRAKNIVEFFKSDGITRQTFIGSHNVGGATGTGSIYLIPYTPTEEPWNGTEGLYISKNQLKLDNKRVPTTNDTAGTVGSSTRPVYVNAGTITQCGTSLEVSITGNAATATRLLTARTINGTSFNGTANITTANWGSARNFYIADASAAHTGAATSVNGSSNITLKLPSTITATLTGTATNAQWLTPNTSLTLGASGLQYFNLDGDAGTSPTVNNTPTSAWYHILRMNHANSKGYYADMAIPLNDTEGIYWRQIRSGTNYGWFKLLDSNNYTKYTVTKTGSGASGTWGINVTGNAGTATRLQTARTIRTNLGSTSTASFDGTANITPGIIGILAVSHGGTGASSASTARTNLGAAAAEHTHSFMDDITGTVPVSRGGTGAWDAGAARSNLGITPANIGAAPSSHNHSASNITSGTLSIARGGTGTSTKGAQSGGALANIGCIYSTSEPSSRYTGMVWLKPVT